MVVEERYRISNLLHKMEQQKEYCDQIGLYNTSKYNGKQLNQVKNLYENSITIKIKPSD